MKLGLNTRGYTIVEVLIVLAVSSALLVAVMFGISGQQRRTEFTQAVNDMQAQINDVMNTVSTGYAINTQNFTCTSAGDGPVFGTGSNVSGQNAGCIVMGRAIHMAPDGTNAAGYNTYTIVGQRQKNGKDVTALSTTTPLSDAVPKVIASSNGATDSFEIGQIQGGVTVTKMYYTTDGTLATAQPTGVVAFLSSLGQYSSGCKDLCSGATNVQLFAVKNTGLGLGQATVTNVSSGINATNLGQPLSSGSVVICLKSGGTDQYGVITIGSNNRQLATDLQIISTAEAEAAGGKCTP